MTPKANTPIIPQRTKSSYVVVREKKGGSSNATKTSATKGLENAERVTVLAQRSNTRGSYLPHYMNAQNASLFANRLRPKSGWQAEIDARQAAARAAAQQANMYQSAGAGAFTGGMDNTMMGLAMAMQGLNAGMGLIGQGLSAFRAPASNNPTQKPAPGDQGPKMDGSRSEVGGGSPSASSASDAINGMKGAQTPAELREAINKAEGEKSKLEGSRLSTEQLNEAKTKLKAASEEVTKKENALSEINGRIKGLEKAVSGQKGVVQDCENALRKASTQYNNACTEFTNAENALTAAKSALEADPDNQQLKTNLEQAQRAYDNAKTAKETAKGAIDNANTQAKQAKDSLTVQENKLEQFQKSLEKLKTEKEKADAELKKAKDDEQGLKEAISNHEKLVNLEASIGEYKNKLQEMVKKHEDKIEQLNQKVQDSQNKINERTERIDETDGVSIAEKERLRKNKNASAKNVERMDEINKLIQEFGLDSMTIGQEINFDGHTFRKVSEDKFQIDGNGEEYSMEKLRQYIIDDNG